MGVNISTISNEVVEVMKENFQKHLEAVLTEVSIFYYKFFNLLVLNTGKREPATEASSTTRRYSTWNAKENL